MKKLLVFALATSVVATLFCFQEQARLSQLPIFADEADFAEVVVSEKPEPSTPVKAVEPKQEVKVEKDVVQTTLGIIKPDAVEAGFSGKIIELIELNRFDILQMQKKTLTRKEAEDFYAVHKERPFFKELVTFMTSGPVVVLELKKLNAVRDWRYLMGSTNPERAYLGTLRAMFGLDITHNAVHGSDSAENAEKEIAFFFPKETVKTEEIALPVMVSEEVETEELA